MVGPASGGQTRKCVCVPRRGRCAAPHGPKTPPVQLPTPGGCGVGARKRGSNAQARLRAAAARMDPGQATSTIPPLSAWPCVTLQGGHWRSVDTRSRCERWPSGASVDGQCESSHRANSCEFNKDLAANSAPAAQPLARARNAFRCRPTSWGISRDALCTRCGSRDIWEDLAWGQPRASDDVCRQRPRWQSAQMT